jgi:ketosteroid isomerase-like protein
MSQGDAEIVRRMYAAFHGGDIEAALAHFDADVILDATRRLDGGLERGPEKLAKTIGRWTSAFDDWREEIEEVRDLGDRVCVVLTQHGRGKGSGIEIATRYAAVYEVSAGKITSVTLYVDPAEALPAPERG